MIFCLHHVHCVACRGDAVWRQDKVNRGYVSERDFECPHGVTKLTASTVQRDAKIKWATTAKQLQDLAKSDIQKCSPCGQKVDFSG